MGFEMSASDSTTSRQHSSSAAPPEFALEMVDVTVGSLANPDGISLEAVDWKVAVGDYWVVGGLQASGKSDLLATATGAMPPLRGTLRVFGQELGAAFDHEHLPTRLRLGLVFDGGRLLNHLTVSENVALPIRYHHNLSAAAAEPSTNALLELIGLSGSGYSMPGAMRPNMRQRVGLARALALKPEVLLLDNPLTGLDPRDIAWWLDLIDQLCAGHPIVDRRPMTLVVTDDNFRPWKDRARQFAILKNKSFVAIGGRSELTTSADSLVQELLRAELLTA